MLPKNISAITKEADLVCAGQVKSVETKGKETISVKRADVAAREVRADIQLARMTVTKHVKGKSAKEIKIRCHDNLAAWLPGLTQGTYIVFLKKQNNVYVPVDPYSFAIPIDARAASDENLKTIRGIVTKTLELGEKSLVRISAHVLLEIGDREKLENILRNMAETQKDNVVTGIAHLYRIKLTLAEKPLPLFKPADIRDWQAFCAKLQQHGNKRAANPGKRIWRLLGSDVKKLARKGAKEMLDANDKKAIIVALNKLLDKRDFYRDKDFKGIKIPEEALGIWQRSKGLISKEEVRRLNRFLIEAFFPEEVVGLYSGVVGAVSYAESTHADLSAAALATEIAIEVRHIRDRDVLPLLHKLLVNPSSKLLRSASRAVGMMGNPSSEKSLTVCVSKSGDLRVQYNCYVGLCMIKRVSGVRFEEFCENPQRHLAALGLSEKTK